MIEITKNLNLININQICHFHIEKIIKKMISNNKKIQIVMIYSLNIKNIGKIIKLHIKRKEKFK